MGKPGMNASLSRLSFDRLRRVVYERLHGRQAIGPPIDPRGDVEPYEWLVEQYQTGGDSLRDRLARLVDEFLREIPDTAAWPEDARGNLLDLAQECGLGKDALDQLIDSRALLTTPGGGPEAHAGLLKCALGLGRRLSPSFWLRQLKCLGDDYGGLAFGGLYEHGFDVAMAHLEECCKSEEAAAFVALAIPSLIENHGFEEVRRAVEEQLPRLPEFAREALSEMLQIEAGQSPAPVPRDQHGTALWTDGRSTAHRPMGDWGKPSPSRKIEEGLVYKAAA